MRTGVIAKKVGMTRLFQEDGRHVPVTVLALEDCQVTSLTAPKIATAISRSRWVRAKRSRKTSTSRSAKHFAKAGVGLKMRVAEFRVDRRRRSAAGRRPISAEHFVAGQKVDITGHTQGKGFAGAMKRWGFGGLARHPRCLDLAPFARFDG